MVDGLGGKGAEPDTRSNQDVSHIRPGYWVLVTRYVEHDDIGLPGASGPVGEKRLSGSGGGLRGGMV